MGQGTAHLLPPGSNHRHEFWKLSKPRVSAAKQDFRFLVGPCVESCWQAFLGAGNLCSEPKELWGRYS